MWRKLYGFENILGWYMSEFHDTVHFPLYNCTLYTVHSKLYGIANILGWYMSDLHDTVHFTL